MNINDIFAYKSQKISSKTVSIKAVNLLKQIANGKKVDRDILKQAQKKIRDKTVKNITETELIEAFHEVFAKNLIK